MESEELIRRIVRLDPEVETTMDISFRSPEALEQSDAYLVTGTVQNVSDFTRYTLLLLMPAKVSPWPDPATNGGIGFMDQERHCEELAIDQQSGEFKFVGRPSQDSAFPTFHLRPLPPAQDPFPS